jgi:hypothetical protein
VSVFAVCHSSHRLLNLDGLTSGYQDATITHELAHELGSIAPPIRNRRNIIVEVALAFVLDVEGENVIRKISPFGSTFDQRVGMLKDMGGAILEVRDT